MNKILSIHLLLGCATLLSLGMVFQSKEARSAGFALSSGLMLIFTLFILFGVLGWYAQRPCGCGSLISGLSWEEHLWFNLLFLGISLLGWWLVNRGHQPPKADQHYGSKGKNKNMQPKEMNLFWRCIDQVFRMHYPNKFAVFPGRPVDWLDDDTIAARRQKGRRIKKWPGASAPDQANT